MVGLSGCRASVISSKLQKTKELYYFSSFRLDPVERRVWCGAEPIHLTAKQFDLLAFFVENAGRVAKKDEILEAVWADTYIEESTLARNVSWLRKKFRECADEPIIETVSKHGYRFVADLRHASGDENVLIVDERTVQHIRGEETFTIDEGVAETNLEVALPPIRTTSGRRVSISPFVLAGFVSLLIAGAAFLGYQSYSRADSTNAVVASHVVPFSGAKGLENSPAFSPDGNQLAYSWNGGEGEASDIYVKLMGAGEPLQLTKTEANEHYPVFSPDGKHIAFVRGKYGVPGDVVEIPSLGGRERTITHLSSGNYSISYSPDGSQIAVIDTENSADAGQFAVYLIDIETGERRRLTAAGEFLGETTPRFSPDGKSLAFVRVFMEDVDGRQMGKQDLFIVPTTGGQPRQLTSDGVVINCLAWAPSGDYIYFVPVRPPNQTIVRRIPADGGRQEIVSTGSKDISNIAISPDGKKMVYAEDTRHWKIWSVLPDGQPGHKVLDSDFTEFFPQFSPDGSRIAFQTDRTGKYEIWTMARDGRDLRQITETPYSASAPQFSPDGSRIVFNQKESDDFANYIVAATGGTPKRITPPGLKEDLPVWSPDGRSIYFASNRSGTRNIWRMDGDGTSEPVQLTKNGGFRAMPSLDGKTVYFLKLDILDQLWRIPADGGEEELMPEFGAAGFDAYWSVTETGIFFITSDGGQGLKAKTYDLADRRVKDAGKYKIPPDLDGRQITLHGTVLLCTIWETSSRLMLADLP